MDQDAKIKFTAVKICPRNSYRISIKQNKGLSIGFPFIVHGRDADKEVRALASLI